MSSHAEEKLHFLMVADSSACGDYACPSLTKDRSNITAATYTSV
jgi:hypothetical protein